MSHLNIVCIVMLIVLIVIYVTKCNESFYIEPNTVVGGDYVNYGAPLELEGPGITAWSGY